MLIRPFQADDAEPLAELFHASVRQVGIRNYSVKQVAAWSPTPPDPADYIRRAEGRIFLVAINNDGNPVGYVDLEQDGHIDHLYCHPDVVRTGIASALYADLERVAKEQGISVLFVEASEGARRLFEREGFTTEKRNEFEMNGVTIHNYLMTKTLSLAPNSAAIRGRTI